MVSCAGAIHGQAPSADRGPRHAAERAVGRAVRHRPRRDEFAPALTNLGVVRLRQDRLDDAAANFEAALHVQPYYPLAEANLGATLLKEGRFDDAGGQLLVARHGA